MQLQRQCCLIIIGLWSTESSVVYDARDGLAVTVPFDNVGLVLLVFLHCHPQATYREVK